MHTASVQSFYLQYQYRNSLSDFAIEICLTALAKTFPQLTLRPSGQEWSHHLPWLGECSPPPPRMHVTWTSPAGCHVNTEHSNKLKQLNRQSQYQNYLALKCPSLTNWRCQNKIPSPFSCFWQLVPSKPPADSIDWAMHPVRSPPRFRVAS